MRLSIRVKLMGGFFLTIVALLVVVVVNIISLRNIHRDVKQLTDEELVVVAHTGKLAALARQEQALVVLYALGGDKATVAELEAVQQQFDDELALIIPLLENKEVSLVQNAAQNEKQVITDGLKMAELFLSGDRAGGLAQMKDFNAAAQQVIGNFEEVVASANGNAAQLQVEIEKVQANASRLGLIVGVIAMLST